MNILLIVNTLIRKNVSVYIYKRGAVATPPLLFDQVSTPQTQSKNLDRYSNVLATAKHRYMTSRMGTPTMYLTATFCQCFLHLLLAFSMTGVPCTESQSVTIKAQSPTVFGNLMTEIRHLHRKSCSPLKISSNTLFTSFRV